MGVLLCNPSSEGGALEGGRATDWASPWDDAQAVQVAAQLVRDAGCEPVVVGDLAAATRFQA
jgi:predicted dinucleotide-binding enzyme